MNEINGTILHQHYVGLSARRNVVGRKQLRRISAWSFVVASDTLLSFRPRLDGDIVRIRAYKQTNGDWTITEVGINGEWFGMTSNGLERVFAGYTLS